MTSTNDMTNEERQEYWGMVIEEFQSSGISKTEYCKNNGIAFSTFQYWYKKFTYGEAEESGSRFAELVDPALEKINVEPVPGRPAQEVRGELSIQYGNIRIQVSSETPMTLLASVLGVLGYA